MHDHTLPQKRIHPLIATAAVSLIMVSLAGVAAMMGVLPSSHSSATPPAPPQLALKSDAALAANTAPGAAPTPEPEPATKATPAAKAPAPAPQIVKHVHVTTPAPQVAHAQPRPAPARETARAQEPAHAPAREPVRAAICDNCGKVEAVQVIQNEPQTNGLGIAAGAVLGGLLGHQIGDGNGKKLATLAGAVGGGMAGNEVERRTRSSTSYVVRVQMEDGSSRSFPFSETPSWNAGDRVQIVNGHLSARS